MQLPKSVMNMQLTPTQGHYTFDQVKKVLLWDVGRIDPAKLPNLKGNVSSHKLSYIFNKSYKLNFSFLVIFT
jgi:AP-3 complex subunit mu